MFSAVAVAVGTAISAFWILSANSWMQTPAGHELRDGIAYPVDWLAVIFNPSFPYRLAHMLTAAYLTTSLVVLAVGARYLLAGRFGEEGRTMMRMAIGMLAALGPLQLFIGDQHGLNTLAHQPIKIAAMEAHWDGSKPGALVLFAWPDEKAETNRFEIAIPKAGSLILKHDPDGLFPGLTSVPAAERPPVVPVFFAFRLMVAIGVLIIVARPGRPVAVVAPAAVRRALVSQARRAWLVARLRGGDRRLDRHRKRTPAVGRLRHSAHRRRDLAGPGRERGGYARPVRAGLWRRVRDGHLLHQSADRPRTGRARDRAAADGHADRPLSSAAEAGREIVSSDAEQSRRSRHGMVPSRDLGRR